MVVSAATQSSFCVSRTILAKGSVGTCAGWPGGTTVVGGRAAAASVEPAPAGAEDGVALSGGVSAAAAAAGAELAAGDPGATSATALGRLVTFCRLMISTAASTAPAMVKTILGGTRRSPSLAAAAG